MAGRRPPPDLSVPSARETEQLGPRKRARRHAQDDSEPTAPQQLEFQPLSRPTANEKVAALSVIEKMRAVEVDPKILKKNAPADPSVVACALAIHFGQPFGTDQDAKDAFGVARTTDVRARWVTGKLARLIEFEPNALADFEAVFRVPTQERSEGLPASASASAPQDAADEDDGEEEQEDGGEEAGGEEAGGEEDGGEDGAGNLERARGYNYERDVDTFVLLMQHETAEWRRLHHLPLWSRAQRERWFTLPNPNVSSGDLCPQPNMRVINRDYRAAQLLPHASAVIDVLARQRDAAEARVRLLEHQLRTALQHTAEVGSAGPSHSADAGEQSTAGGTQ